MTETRAPITELASQYRVQVTGDLERNVKEQERIGAEITALQERLTALRQDHTVLMTMQQALGITTAPAKPAAGPTSAALPSFRKAAAAEPGQRTARKPAAKKAAAEASGTAKTARPTLVGLIRRHLAEQSEPRSAAEISAALGQAHPERGIKTKVVRVTLEGLVAKSQAQRTKQGASVFYTAPPHRSPRLPPGPRRAPTTPTAETWAGVLSSPASPCRRQDRGDRPAGHLPPPEHRTRLARRTAA